MCPTFHPKPTKKIHQSKFLVFPEMEVSRSDIKKFLYFIKRKHLLYFQKRSPVLFSPSSKNKTTPPQEYLLCFRKQKTLKDIVCLIFFVRILLITNFFRLNFFQNVFIRIFFIIRFFSHQNYQNLLYRNRKKFLYHK